MTTKDGETDGRTWTLFKFTTSDGQVFGTFSDTYAKGLLALEGHFVEIVYEVKKNGNHIIAYRDVTGEEAPFAE